MSQKATLKLDHEDPDCTITDTVYVKKAVLTDMHIRLEGLDPSQYPDQFREEIKFFSKNLCAYIHPDDPVEVVSVEPSEKPVPTANPTF